MAFLYGMSGNIIDVDTAFREQQYEINQLERRCKELQKDFKENRRWRYDTLDMFLIMPYVRCSSLHDELLEVEKLVCQCIEFNQLRYSCGEIFRQRAIDHGRQLLKGICELRKDPSKDY